MANSALTVVPQTADGGEPSDNTPDIGHHQKLMGWIKSDNIAFDLDEETLSKIGERVIKEYKIDENSRADWKTKTEQAMDLAMQVAKEKQFPWPKAANVIFPLMTTASVQFAARAYPGIIQSRSVVKGVVIGDDKGQPLIDPQTGQQRTQPGPGGQPTPMWQVPPGAKQAKADGIGEHMSWQLLDEMPEWEPETDTMLHVLPIVGCDFRKSYFDPSCQRNKSLRVSAMHCVINYKAKSLETAPRISEEMLYYPLEIEEMCRSDLWIKPENGFGQPSNQQDGDDDAPHDFIEQHRTWDLDEDGYAEPYIVTVHKESHKVVRIVARYDADGIHFHGRTHKLVKIEPIHYYTKYDFLPNPDGGIYGIGFGQLLRPINEAVNTTLNQLIDAGTLQNTGGGFIGKGLSMNAGAIRFQMGEFKVVNTSGSNIRDSLVPMDWKGPSPVLLELLGMLVDSGKEVAAIKDVLTGEGTTPNTPATTTLAIIEQGLKVFSAIYKRIHRSLKQELDKLYKLNQKFGDPISQYKVGDTWKQITKDDYVNGSGVEPVSDPTMVTDMQKLGRAQYLGMFANDPWFNPREVRERMLQAANIDGIDRLLVQQPPANPEIAAKGMELEIRGREIQDKGQLLLQDAQTKKAQEVLYYAQAINQLATADKAVGDQHIQWLSMHIGVWEKQFEAANQTTPEGQSAPSGPSPPPPNLPHPMGPMGAPQQQMEQPPIGGARKARDGKWYLPDQSRPGKYLMVH